MSRAASRPRPILTFLKLALCILIPGVVLAGALWVPIDSMLIAAPHALVIFALLLAILAFFRRWRGTALALLAASAVAGAMLAVPLLPSDGARNGEGKGSTKLRLVSFNMYRENAQVKEAIDWVIRQKADFVILVEAVPAHSAEIARLKAVFPYSYGCSASSFCSTLILSRHPAGDVWHHSRGDPENRKALSAVTARFSVGGQDVPVTAVHLDRPWPLGSQEQYLGLLTDAIASVGRRGIMAGDFNSAPWTFAMRRLAEAGELHLASGATGTWPADRLPHPLRLPLDQVYIGPCMTREAVQHGPELGSDHLPIVTDIIVGDCGG